VEDGLGCAQSRIRLHTVRGFVFVFDFDLILTIVHSRTETIVYLYFTSTRSTACKYISTSDDIYNYTLELQQRKNILLKKHFVAKKGRHRKYSLLPAGAKMLTGKEACILYKPLQGWVVV